MKLITEALAKQLTRNGELNANGGGHDFKPVLKLFSPVGAATWLITEREPDYPDILFGLCDLGMGFPELGSVSLTELLSIRLPFGLRIERDLHFVARWPLSVYADAAREAGCITEDEKLLVQVSLRRLR
jgi:hypothetical protein